MNYLLPDFFPSNRWAHKLASNFLIVTAINIFIAAFITYLVSTGLNFWGNLTYSFCIGYLMWLFLDAGRMMIWGVNRPPVFKFFLLCLIAIPSARILGGMMAVGVLGIPDKQLSIMLDQNPLRFFIVTIMTSVFIIWLFWNRSKMACLIADAETEKARIAAIEKQAMQTQLQLLQAQIEPHMLFNTLANLQGLIALDPARAQHMLDQLILYLRATLSSARAEKTTLAHEFSLMQAYLELMSIRMGSRLTYVLLLPDHLRELSIPPMLLQPLIENAIKHGVEPKIEGGSITVVAKQEADMLLLTVADTGLGLRSADSATDSDSITASTTDTNAIHVGLSNIRERLQALFGARASLSITSNTPHGVLAQITIPLS